MAGSRIISVAGGTASGKTTLAHDLARMGGVDRVQVIPLDSYYRCRKECSLEERGGINYDHPDAFETSLLRSHLDDLISGKGIEMPLYDFATHSRSSKTEKINPKQLIIVEGILALHYPELRAAYSYSIFVDTPDQLRFSRRLERDVRERGRTEESVHSQWNTTVHPMHVEFCAPTRALASEVMSGESWDARVVSDLFERVTARVS